MVNRTPQRLNNRAKNERLERVQQALVAIIARLLRGKKQRSVYLGEKLQSGRTTNGPTEQMACLIRQAALTEPLMSQIRMCLISSHEYIAVMCLNHTI